MTLESTNSLDTRRCCDVESTSKTLIQSRTDVVCPVVSHLGPYDVFRGNIPLVSNKSIKFLQHCHVTFMCGYIFADETTGATDDYVKGAHDVKYPICPEIRGNGFIVNEDQIQPSYEEMWNGFVAHVVEIEVVEGW